MSGVRAELRGRVAEAIAEVHVAVLADASPKPFKHWNYPRLVSPFGSGMANFSRGDGPSNYRDAVGRAGAQLGAAIDREQFPAFMELLRFARSCQQIIDRVTGGVDLKDDAELITEWRIGRMAGSVLERLVHTDLPLDSASFEGVYEPLERSLFDDLRPISILVPLACVACEVDAFQISNDAELVRMNDLTQIARMNQNSFGRVQETLVGAATHALVISGGEIGANHFGQTPEDGLPVEALERALQAIRVGSNLVVGYTQIATVPVGWASQWTTNLPPVEFQVTQRRYPPSLDNFGWLSEPTVLTKDHLLTAAEILDRIEASPKRVRQALRRVDRAQLREDHDDVVVDCCIGLESLLDDTTHSETTHKCALRAAAVLSRTDDLDPVLIYKLIKRSYGLRSAIVHGQSDSQISKLRTLRDDDNEYNVGSWAWYLVHRLIIAMLRNPAWAKPEVIDELLLLGTTVQPNPESGAE